MQDFLDTANAVLMVLGATILAHRAYRRARFGRSFAGEFGPLRRLQPGPELIFVPVFIYLLAFAALYRVVTWRMGPTEPAAEPPNGRPSIDLAALIANNLAMLVGALACWEVGRRGLAAEGRAFVRGAGGLRRSCIEALSGVLIAIAVCQSTLYVTVWLIKLVRPDFVFAEHNVIDALRAPDRPAWLPAALWIGVVLVTPVAEELFFRGLLQTGLIQVFGRRDAAIVLAGIIFGFAHSSQPQVVPAIAVFGVVLGILYERTGALVAPILAHALFNAKTLLWESLTAS